MNTTLGSSRLPQQDLDLAVDRVGDRWRTLDGMKLFFSGGTGFIGSWMMAVLLRAIDRGLLSAQVRLLTRSPLVVRKEIAGHPAVDLVEGNVLADGWDCLGCTHLVMGATAASADLLKMDPALMFRTVVEGTRNTLDKAQEAGVGRALFLSSGAANGRQPPEVDFVGEEQFFGPDPLAPGSAYSEGKRAGEHLLALASLQGMSVSVARLWAFVGPLLPLDQHFAIGNFLRDTLEGKAIQILGDGTTVRSFQYAADMAAWTWTILAAGENRKAYNVGSEESITIRDLATECAELGLGIKIEVHGKPDPHRRADIYVPSTARALSELGLRNAVPLRDALRRTFLWHQAGAGSRGM